VKAIAKINQDARSKPDQKVNDTFDLFLGYEEDVHKHSDQRHHGNEGTRKGFGNGLRMDGQ
jgi:hypothetical protein